MPISAPNVIAENSAATPGLWNSIVTQLWQNDQALSTGGFSTNTLSPESGNTIFATSSMFSTADLRAATFYPAAISGTPTWAATQSMNIGGNAATATLAASATALANPRTIGGVSFDGTANITVASATGGFTVTGGTLSMLGGTFTTTLISTTAQATLGTLSATQFSAYASTVSGATLQGFGTTGDVTLKNRAGTDVVWVVANTTTLQTAGALTIAGAFTGATSMTFTTSIISTTALATPSTLSATQFTAFASTASGATLMGYGTTYDVTLKNRAGTDVLGIGPNSTAVTLPGTLSIGRVNTNGGNFELYTTGADNFYIERFGGTAGTRGKLQIFHSQFGYTGGTGADTVVDADWGIGLRVNKQSSVVLALLLTNGQSVVCNSAAISTTATDGFLYLPACAGAPAGTPTTFTGRIPFVVDSTNHKAYIYSGGSWVALN